MPQRKIKKSKRDLTKCRACDQLLYSLNQSTYRSILQGEYIDVDKLHGSEIKKEIKQMELRFDFNFNKFQYLIICFGSNS